MHYLVDGYNFVFRLGRKNKKNFQALREEFIKKFSHYVEKHNLHVTLVFDGKDLPSGSYTRGNWKNIEVVYTHHGLTADAYLLDQITHFKKAASITIVTSDKQLAIHARVQGSHVMSVEDFMQFLVHKEHKKHPQSEKPVIRDTGFHFDRLLKIFEEKLKNEE